MPNTAQERRVRRLLAQDNRALVKYREDSRWYRQYGPYAVVDEQTTGLVEWGIDDLDALEAELRQEQM